MPVVTINGLLKMDVEKVLNWFIFNKLPTNYDKSSTINFGEPTIKKLELKYNALDDRTTCKYLGTHIDKKNLNYVISLVLL